MKIAIVHGPNLNLLGKRQPEIYGSMSFDDFLLQLEQEFIDVEFHFFQSNHEGVLVDEIQKLGETCEALIINAAAYTHTSIAIADALAAVSCQKIEVHISNPFNRESFRRQSLLSPFVEAVICGMKFEGYRYALHYITQKK